MAQESSNTLIAVAFRGPLGQVLPATYITPTTAAASIDTLAATSTATAQATVIRATTSTTVTSAVTHLAYSAIPVFRTTAANVAEATSAIDISKLGRDLGKHIVDNIAGEGRLAKLASVLLAAGAAAAFDNRASIFRLFRRLIDRVGLQRLLNHPGQHRQEIQEEINLLRSLDPEVAARRQGETRRRAEDPDDEENPHEARRSRLDVGGHGGDDDNDLPQAHAEHPEQPVEAGVELLQQLDEVEGGQQQDEAEVVRQQIGSEINQRSDMSMPDASDGVNVNHQRDNIEVSQEPEERGQETWQEVAGAGSQQNEDAVGPQIVVDHVAGRMRELAIHFLWKQIRLTSGKYEDRAALISALRPEIAELRDLDFLTDMTASEAFEELVRLIDEEGEKQGSTAGLQDYHGGFQVPSDSPSPPHRANSLSDRRSRLNQATVGGDEVEEGVTEQSLLFGRPFQQTKTGTLITTISDAFRSRARNLDRTHTAGVDMHSVRTRRGDFLRDRGLRPVVPADLRRTRRAVDRPGIILERSVENTPVESVSRHQVVVRRRVADVGSSQTSSPINNRLSQGRISRRTSSLRGPVNEPHVSLSSDILAASARNEESMQPEARSHSTRLDASPVSTDSSSLSDPPSSPALVLAARSGRGLPTPVPASNPTPASMGRSLRPLPSLRRFAGTRRTTAPAQASTPVPATPLRRSVRPAKRPDQYTK